MMSSDPTTQLKNQAYLKFVNEASIEKKKIKIRSFYLFHKCQYLCLKDLNNKESETCMQNCQFELDKFHEFRKSKRPESKIFYALPQDLKQIEEMNLSQDEYMLSKKKIADYRKKTQIYVENMKLYLDDWEKLYKK
ncbi:hypothetical protein TTHERM_000030359 (macronuclear) [Tetrahymena thermophila SB210]|uniref:Tim10/DDP family zinc finger protein n=1 Tax=Tetrahymena thermophila (strain SB210) TaxID=312017 RepID=W7XBZ1_TETTS|nr:hypothetical protein TTHERM_000030359 [Tetrahymena thermophila SB210]EWS74847.1 hypothetical protein TTHERM_000030359 [Tetrahymena thermophila SB210]|eukprot:XP_012652560.1 hypothetical protein TTHERM_000030359 [Tetrahymena thermophila SB210]